MKMQPINFQNQNMYSQCLHLAILYIVEQEEYS